MISTNYSKYYNWPTFLTAIIIGLIIYCVWDKSCQKQITLSETFNDPHDVKFKQLENYWFLEAVYMREYIIRAVHRLDSQQPIIDRLHENALKIADLIGGTGTNLYFLFTRHITLFIKVVTSIITYDGEYYDEFSYAWAKNGALIAETKLNPQYSSRTKTTYKNLWMTYLTRIEKEIRAIQKQKPGLYEFDDVIESTRQLSLYNY